MAWTAQRKQDTGAIISRKLWQDIVDNVNYLYNTYLLTERDGT